ncbi:MAG: hypothetical protein ACE5GX_17450 [Thermoanaerobaculia bacterium]
MPILARRSAGVTPSFRVLVAGQPDRPGPFGGAPRLDLATPQLASGSRVEGETVFSSEVRPVRDRIRARLESERGWVLEVEAGYRPEDPK